MASASIAFSNWTTKWPAVGSRVRIISAASGKGPLTGSKLPTRSRMLGVVEVPEMEPAPDAA